MLKKILFCSEEVVQVKISQVISEFSGMPAVILMGNRWFQKLRSTWPQDCTYFRRWGPSLASEGLAAIHHPRVLIPESWSSHGFLTILPFFFSLHCLQVLPPRAPSHCVVAGWLLSEDCSLLLGIQCVPDLARASVETGAVRMNNGLLHYCRAISHGRHSSTKISKYTWGLRIMSLSFGRVWQVLFTRVTWITTWAKLLVSSCS